MPPRGFWKYQASIRGMAIFMQLGGLDAGDAEVQPAPGALGDIAEQGHRNQQ
jgi:hypothetical protein